MGGRASVADRTGRPRSEQVGFALQRGAGRSKVLLELGGDAACVVDEGSDVDHVVSRIGFGAFYYAGQSWYRGQRTMK